MLSPSINRNSDKRKARAEMVTGCTSDDFSSRELNQLGKQTNGRGKTTAKSLPKRKDISKYIYMQGKKLS